jgi:transcriptional regulator with XRE-family HTH domain
MMTAIMRKLQDADLRKAFGQRLKSLRKEKGFTQKEVAAHLGVLHTHFNKYESGMAAPPFEKLVLLAKLLGTSLDFLVLGQVPDDAAFKANTGLLERFKRIQSFDRRDQETVAEVIDAMIAKSQMKEVLKPIPV